MSDTPGRRLGPLVHAFKADGSVAPLGLARAFATAPRESFRAVRDVRIALKSLAAVA